MKRILKIAGIVLLAVILLVVSVPYLFKDKIEALIKEEGNKMLNARFDFGNLDISLIRNFGFSHPRGFLPERSRAVRE